MFRVCRLLALVCAVAACSAAHAQSARFELTPFVGYRMGGDFDIASDSDSGESVDLDPAASYGISVCVYRDNQSFYELLYSRQQASLDSKRCVPGQRRRRHRIFPGRWHGTVRDGRAMDGAVPVVDHRGDTTFTQAGRVRRRDQILRQYRRRLAGAVQRARRGNLRLARLPDPRRLRWAFSA